MNVFMDLKEGALRHFIKFMIIFIYCHPALEEKQMRQALCV